MEAPTSLAHLIHPQLATMLVPIAPDDRPRTPVMKRILRDVLHRPALLGKRGRSPTPPPPLRPQSPPAHCVALQTEDAAEDAVVITALRTVPFCCHADLLLMRRGELRAAAHALNARLPAALRIDAGPAAADAAIRAAIERLVGIRGARDREVSLYADVRTAQDGSRTVTTVLPPSPISPLAARSRTRRASTTFEHSFADRTAGSVLAALREDDEREADRHSKRRRTSHDADDSSPEATPTPAPRVAGRARPHGVRPKRTVPAPPPGARAPLRSQSQRLPERRSVGACRNVIVSRGSGGRARAQSVAVLTSTPRAARVAARGHGMRGEREADAFGGADMSSFDSPGMVSAATTVSEMVDSPRGMEMVSGWLGRGDVSGEGEQVQEVTGEMMRLSLSGLSVASGSDMDLSE